MLPSILLALALLSRSACGNWLYLAVSGSSAPTDWPSDTEGDALANGLQERSLSGCGGLDLTPEQVSLCETQPFAMRPVALGARDALVECQWQFKYERWNCVPRPTPGAKLTDLFANTLKSGNKEAAFISAITSAGIVYAVTKSCSSGNLTECNCNSHPSTHRRYHTEEGSGTERWTWGGCSDDVGYGVRFSRRFLDQAEKTAHAQSGEVRHLINLHNHEVGRRTMEEQMRKQCRCHGVSGSCDFKTCWLQMAKFKAVGSAIKERYDHLSVMVKKRAKRKLRRKEKSERRIPIRPEELVYVAKSPDYCEPNIAQGIEGTQGRECNSTRTIQRLMSPDSCDVLCCGRGYNQHETLRSEKCHCKFVWCCHVKCKTCSSLVTITTCK